MEIPNTFHEITFDVKSNSEKFKAISEKIIKTGQAFEEAMQELRDFTFEMEVSLESKQTRGGLKSLFTRIKSIIFRS